MPSEHTLTHLTPADWDWRYRAAFDPDLRSKIHSVQRALGDRPEASLFRDQVHAWSKRLSLDALLRALDEDDRALEMLDTIPSDAIILPIPRNSYSGFEQRIARLDLPRRARSALTTILDSATRAAHTSLYPLMQLSFGTHLAHVQSLLRTREPVASVRPLVPNSEGASLAARTRLFQQAMEDLAATAPCGTIPDYELVVSPGKGYGEYWPGFPESPDTLVLYENGAHLDQGTLETTLVHEVIGHGCFYDWIHAYHPPVVDHGALCFTEGWATWCEWYLHPSAPAGPTPAQVAHGRAFHEPEYAESWIAAGVRESGGDETMVRSSILTHYQYPGLQLSYVLGALWFEAYMAPGEPAAFFGDIAGRPWGDFFPLWA